MAQTATITERTFRPVGSYIMVEPKEIKETKGGILLADTEASKTQEGTVIGVGRGKITEQGLIKFSDLDIEVGSTVLFQKYGYTKIKVGDKEILVLDMDDILGVFNG